jgi:hypothetical protein
MDFKIDTGADVSVVPESAFCDIEGVTLETTTKTLTGPSQQPLKVCGQFKGLLTYGANEMEEEIFVVRDLQTALMGRPAIEGLNLLSRINSVQDTHQKIMSKYTNLFQGLGEMEARALPYPAERRCKALCTFYSQEGGNPTATQSQV